MFPLSIPNGWAASLVAFGISFCFGFVLERAGFGDSRRLAAQFYFHETRVLKVMFTAIVTAMVLLHWGVALGWVELERVYVNETYLTSAIVGGLVLGMGFIIGGYCPGTSIVAAATGKVDGLFFVLVVTFGVFVFGESYLGVREFYEHSGYMGRFRLPELFGVNGGVVVFGVVLMALFMFWGAEQLERVFASNEPEGYDQ
jgi:hypothetical protein